MLEYNDKTRGLQDRGTRLCISIAEECAGISKFPDAMKCFADRELPEMGEAYWRAISYIMQAYAESGKSPYYESALIEKRIFSNKNAEAKRFRKVNLFGKNSEFIQKRILSFAAMADEVREYIRSESANTVLIAELINPVGRNDSSIFSGKQEVNTYSALSGFIGSYVTWLEGKSRQNSLGQIREPMPYYFFKREMVLKYALACGSTSIEEIGEYLEFAGNSELNIKSPKEILIMRAIEYCEKYSSNKQIIGIIRNMQSLLLYFEAERAIEGSIKAVEFEKFIKKRVDKITNIFLYEPAINALNGKKRELTKQELISGYYSQLFLWNMLMEIICRTDSDMKMEDYAPMVIDVSLFMDNNYYADEGFINWTTWPERMTEEYIKELQEIYFIDDGAINKKRVFSNLVERVLAELVKKILPLEYLRDECSFELKMFYEKQFYTLSGIRQYYFDVLTKQGLENYSKLLDWTVKASILFAFHSGCKNFSLTWYEKKFRINHFQNKYKDESGKGIDGYTWHRWTVSMDNFEKQENMWEMIALDAKRIRKCYRYLEKNNAELIIKDIYERYNIQRDKVHKECIELLVWMKKHNMGIMDEVVSKLRYCEKELDGN